MNKKDLSERDNHITCIIVNVSPSSSFHHKEEPNKILDSIQNHQSIYAR